MSSSTVDSCNGDGVHDTNLIRSLVSTSDTLRFGAVRCVVTGTILLDANTVITGLGETRSTIFYSQGAGDSAPFLVDHSGHDIVVEKMHFEGTATWHQFAVLVYGGQNVTLRNSYFSKIGLLGASARDNNQNTTDEAALARNIYVLADTVLQGVCGVVQCSGSGSHQNAVEITYALDGQVLNNSIKNFTTGIAIIGGNAETQPDRARMAGRFLIEGNRIDQVDTGIMTSNAHDVNVNRNFVTNCSDTCLDAEGSATVGFFDNTAYDAGNYTFSSFYNAETVVFNWNRLRKDGSWTDENGNSQTTTNVSLLRIKNGNSSLYKRIGLRIHNNLIAWDGPGIGNVYKETAGSDPANPSTNYLLFDNNELYNVAARWSEFAYDQGTIEMRGNRIVFTAGHAPDQPAISVVGTHLPGNVSSVPLNASWHLEIAGNYISSSDKSPLSAVRVLQNCGCTVNTLLLSNEIHDFATSIEVISRAFNPNTGFEEHNPSHYFEIQDNGVSGTVNYTETYPGTVSESGTHTVPNT